MTGAPNKINRDIKPLALTASVRANAPEPDETEITLLGPGFGECLVMHIGRGQWIIIDSCIGDDGSTPAALAYIEHMGLDASKVVSHFVITHADNDHIGGAPAVFEACKSAKLVLSQALTEREVLAWIAVFSRVDPTSLARASTNIASLIENADEDRLMFGLEDRPLFEEAHGKLTALSPSDAKIKAFIGAVVAQLPKAGQPRRRVHELSPNQASMALLLETPACTAILGADLEEDPGQGWTRIVNHSFAYRKSANALVIKVAHHGSPNAHCEAIWNRLEKPPVAMLTTFNKGETRRPAPDDVARILSQTEAAFCCSSFARMGAQRDHDVDKLLGLLDIKRKRRFPPLGHIRFRVKPNCEPTVELFGDATHLSRVHNAA